jgi:hypothetical protein
MLTIIYGYMFLFGQTPKTTQEGALISLNIKKLLKTLYNLRAGDL